MNDAPGKVISILGKRVEGPLLTVSQFEERHPATRDRMRGYIMRADQGIPMFAGLSNAIIRVGRSVMIDEMIALGWFESLANRAKSQPRNPHGRAGKRNSQ
jgi:hypothetical protein